MVGGQHQIAFVFAVFLVHQNDHATSAEFGNDFADGGNWRGGGKTLGHKKNVVGYLPPMRRRGSIIPC
jgi:hypothetical protein